MGKMFEELKRRKVFRVAAVYAVVAWVLIQVADTILPALQMPDWTISFVTVLFFLGFPIAVILAWAYEVTPEGILLDSDPRASSIPQTTAVQPVNYLILAIVLLVAGFQMADRFITNGPVDSSAQPEFSSEFTDAASIRANLVLGEAKLNPNSNTYGNLALSPDGQHLAYANYLTQDSNIIRIQEMATGGSQLLSTSNPENRLLFPSFSPSSDQVLAFASGIGRNPGRLVVTNINGGSFRELVSNASYSFTWYGDDAIIYSPQGSRGLRLKFLSGGDEIELPINLPEGKAVNTPAWIPGTPWILYQVDNPYPSQIYAPRIELFNVDSGETRSLLDRGFQARYAPSGHLVFMRDGDLWAAPFDRESISLQGEPAMIEQGVEHFSPFGFASFTFSNNGRLIYRRGLDGFEQTGSSMLLKDLAGNAVPHSITSDMQQGRFSRDGSKLVFTQSDSTNTRDIVVYDIASQLYSRLTFGGNAERPVWSPDGQWVVYRQGENGNFQLLRTRADGTGRPEILLSSEVSITATSFSPDGSQIIFARGTANSSSVGQLSLGFQSAPIRELFADSIGAQDGAEISPDGRWIAYMSVELGGPRIFVHPFPETQDGKWLVADIDAREAHWSSDNNLFIGGGDGNIYRVPLNVQSGFRPGAPELVTRAGSRGGSMEPNFNVSPDGRYILYLQAADKPTLEADILVLVENWFSRLQELAPARK